MLFRISTTALQCIVCQIEALVECGVCHVVLAVSYQADQLEQEMQVSMMNLLCSC